MQRPAYPSTGASPKTEGGSYGINIAFNYYSQWLVNSVGEYPQPVWQVLWTRHGSPIFRNYHNMRHTLPTMIALLHQHDSETLFNPKLFEARESKALGRTFIGPKPIAQFKDGVELRCSVGTRGNGMDQPRWPRELSVEIVE